MPIPFSCDCGKKLQAKDEFAGRKLRCPGCGRVLTIPGVRVAQPTQPMPRPQIPPLFREPPAPPPPSPAAPPPPRFELPPRVELPPAPEAPLPLVPLESDPPPVQAPRLRPAPTPAVTSFVPLEPAPAPEPEPTLTEEEPPLVRFVCACGRRLKALRSDAGATIDCPTCGRGLVVPSGDAVAPPAVPSVPQVNPWFDPFLGQVVTASTGVEPADPRDSRAAGRARFWVPALLVVAAAAALWFFRDDIRGAVRQHEARQPAPRTAERRARLP